MKLFMAVIYEWAKYCPWQAIPAWSNVSGKGWGLTFQVLHSWVASRRACAVKHNRFVMYGFHSKLVKVNGNSKKTLSMESVFYSTGPGLLYGYYIILERTAMNIHSSLFGPFVSYKEKSFITWHPDFSSRLSETTEMRQSSITTGK
jgi:hypothetical protein